MRTCVVDVTIRVWKGAPRRGAGRWASVARTSLVAGFALSASACAFLEIGADSEPVDRPAATASRLPVPAPKPAPPTAPAEVTREIAPAEPQAEPSGEPGIHRVRPGETVYDVARRHGVDAYTLITLNELRPPFNVEPGQRLILPGGALASPSVRSGPPAGYPGTEAGSPGSGRPVPRPSEAASQSASGSGRQEERTAAVPHRSEPLSEPPPATGGFVWPVQGRILSEFGPKKGGMFNDGINIAAVAGTPVRAAEAGVVAYAGNELRGFGNMLLLKHNGGWVTAYAHASDLLVKRGDRVRRGQTIAKVGATGAVDEPQLHFEIRKGKRAIDPLRELPRPSASARDGAG